MTESIKNKLDWTYRLFVGLVLVYIAYELKDLKSMSRENKQEINFVNSKLDYVTSDINTAALNAPE